MTYIINMVAAVIIGFAIGHVTGIDTGKEIQKQEFRNAVCESFPNAVFCQ